MRHIKRPIKAFVRWLCRPIMRGLTGIEAAALQAQGDDEGAEQARQLQREREAEIEQLLRERDARRVKQRRPGHSE